MEREWSIREPILALTMGDPAGIGPEIMVKAFAHQEIFSKARPFVIGSRVVLEDALKMTSSPLIINPITDMEKMKGPGYMDLLDLENIQQGDYQYGEIGARSGKASVEYILTAIDMANRKEVQAVVTGPIHKEAINAAGYNYAGHTEIFAHKTGTRDYAMMLTSSEMRVIHVSTHVSLREACERVKEERVYRVIELAHKTVKDLKIENPKIVVAGLNPHAGEQGLFGREEIEEIIPAIERAKRSGIQVDGPLPPDTIFSKVRGGWYDIAVVMYHDQGHIPMKVTGFQYDRDKDQWTSIKGVNTTVGLPFIRTSVDHGVAFGKAGKGRANEESLVEAILMAAQLSKRR